MEYRNECKHFVNYADFLALRARLDALMARDPNAGPDGGYRIRSLYFDDLRDTALLEKLNGVNARDKYRIRYYNDDISLINLEKKSKLDGLCAKRAAALCAEEVRRILANDTAWMAQSRDPLTVEFYTKLAAGLLPKTVVEYARIPFVCEAGNVRVTLDSDIRTGMEVGRFLEPDCMTAPLPEPVALLEVKWDAFLPSYIRDAVQLGARRAEAFSKYAACRVYG
jgi:hypothetical protein